MTERELFVAAFQIEDLEARGRFIDQQCGGDLEMAQRVRQLLAKSEGAGGFLQQPVADFGSDWPETAPPSRVQVARPGRSDSPVAEESFHENFRAGESIGPYRLVEKLGEGGMGQVWMAAQHHPVKRTVALKLIGSGLDSRSVLQRFEAERHALSLMEHDNIARVLDAGTTPTGRPYFVMELVKGVPITRYCDDHQLELSQRMTLFCEVCRAIQHAHHKGIIHRDIKPGNVLVTELDGHPTAKVIDFGVAKALHQPLTEKTFFTQFGQLVGTLEYMSPEQARLNQLDIDTRSDVYSLGVLLYELLTGTTPFERQRLREAAFDEMLRIIREEDPPRPSDKLSSSDTLPSVAAQRKVEPARLNRLVRGELDWIVMKSLEKDRDRRYESAAALAADIENYMHDRAVNASPPSVWYRTRKFVRRHRWGVGSAALVAALLIGGISALWIERNRTRAEFVRAESNLRLAREALENAYLQIGEKWHPADESSQRVREAFLREALRYFEQLTRENEASNEVGLVAAAAHFRVAQLHEQLSDRDAAAAEYQTAIALYAAINEQRPLPWDACQTWSGAHMALGQIGLARGNIEHARTERSAALGIVEEYRQRSPSSWPADLTWIRIQRTIAYDLASSRQAAEAERRVRQCEDVCVPWTLTEPVPDDAWDERVSIKGQLASLAKIQQRPDDAIALRNEQLALVEGLAQTRRTPAAIGLLGYLQLESGLELETLGKPEDARTRLEMALENIAHVVDSFGSLEQVAPENYKLLIDAAEFYHRRQEWEHAIHLAAAATKVADALATVDPNDLSLQEQRVKAYRTLAGSLMTNKQFAESLQALKTPVEVYRRLRGNFPENAEFIIRWATAVDQRARAQLSAGDEAAAIESWSAAEKDLQESVDKFEYDPPVHNLLGRIRLTQADHWLAKKRADLGMEMFRKALLPLAESVRLGDSNFASVDDAIEAHLKYAYLSSRDDDEVSATLDTVDELLKIAWRQFPNHANFHELGSAMLVQRANFALRHNDLVNACRSRELAIEQIQLAAKLDPQRPQRYQSALTNHYIEYGGILSRVGRAGDALGLIDMLPLESLPTGERKWAAVQMIGTAVREVRSGLADDTDSAQISKAVTWGKRGLAELSDAKLHPIHAVGLVWLLASGVETEWRNPPEAIRIAQSLLATELSTTDRNGILVGLAAAQLRTEDVDGCLKTLGPLVADEKNATPRAALLQGLALHKKGDSDGANRFFQMARARLADSTSPEDQALLNQAAATIGE